VRGAAGTGYTLSSGYADRRSNGECGRAAVRRPEMENSTNDRQVTVEEVERVAELAHLELTPEETVHMLGD